MVLSIAVLFIVGIVAGIGATVERGSEQRELARIADRVASAIDSAAASPIEMVLVIRSDGGSPGLQIPATANGHPYHLELSPGSVTARDGGLGGNARIGAVVHLFRPPSGAAMSASGIAALDREQPMLVIPSGVPLVLQTTSLPGEGTTLLFAYSGAR